MPSVDTSQHAISFWRRGDGCFNCYVYSWYCSYLQSICSIVPTKHYRYI